MINGIKRVPSARERVLITGASGLLGRYLLDTVPRQKYSVVPLYFSNNAQHNQYYCDVWYYLDITDPDHVMSLFDRVKPDIVIHCASPGSVDYCENNPKHAVAVTVDGTANVLVAALQYHVKVVYISSNAVFKGLVPPYSEQDERYPVNMYGVTKKNAEDLVMGYPNDWMIIRPIMLYGWPYPGGRGNWATRFNEFFKASMPLRIVNDTVTQPTYAGDCADAVWELMLKGFGGIIHVGGQDVLTLDQYASVFCDVWGFSKSLIEPVPSSYFTSLAKRPKDTTYSLTCMVQEGLVPVRLCDGLRRMKGEL